MKITKTRLFTFALVPLILFLAYMLFSGIKGKIDLDESIKRSEARTIEKLKLIREAQKLFLSNNGRYTANWDSLMNFVLNDTFYIVEKKEIIEPRKPNDPLLYTNTDSIRIQIDTIGFNMVRDYLYPKEKYPKLNVDSLPYITGKPGMDGHKYEMFAGEVLKGNILVKVVEVVDKHPLDRSRNDESKNPRRWYLRFGSKTDVSVSGNWE